MSAARPVVLVHGALHGAWCWAAVQAELDRRGVASYAVDLPGHGASTDELADLLGNAAALARAVDRVRERASRPAVLVGHSYGGTVIGEAARPGAVDHLVFVAALVTEVGESANDTIGALPRAPEAASSRPVFVRHPDGNVGVDPEAALPVFYNASPPAVAAAAAARLCRQRPASLGQPATQAAWRRLASTYVRCTQDRAIPPAAQDRLVARLPAPAVVTLQSDHSPFFCAPAALAEVLASLAQR